MASFPVNASLFGESDDGDDDRKPAAVEDCSAARSIANEAPNLTKTQPASPELPPLVH